MFAILRDRKGFYKDHGFIKPNERYIEIFEYQSVKWGAGAESGLFDTMPITTRKLRFYFEKSLTPDGNVALFQEE